MDEKRYLGLLDMLNGGGPGQAGPEFMGGPLSGLLNALGIRPMGAGRAMEESPSPMPRPMPMPAQMPAPALTPPVMPAVEAQQLPPSLDEILAALSAAPRGPYATPSAPQSYPSLQEITAMMEADRMKRLYSGFGQ
jgi:hypothetical protein